MDPKSFENALAFLLRRARKARPARAVDSQQPKAHLPNGRPDFKGKPPIYGMQDWLYKMGYSDAQLASLNIIHVAGTKGKGSTCAFVESFLRAHGKRTNFPRKTGLYTSPHLIQINERIRIDFNPIPKEAFAKYVFEVRERLSLNDDNVGPRYLQLLALISFHAFLQEGVDVAIYETHHGGEYDATNVIKSPIITAITSIGIDHIVDLGPSIENIAWHKSGIFKPGAIAFSAPQEANVAQVLKDRAAEKGVQLKFVNPDSSLIDDFDSSVQKLNCSLAREISDAFLRRKAADEKDSALTQSDISEGIQQFQWPGRFQRFTDGSCTWFLDGAHNEISIVEAAEWFRQASNKESHPSTTRILIFAQNSDQRDGEAVLRGLAKSLRVPLQHVVFTTYHLSEGESTPDEKSILEHYSRIWSENAPNTPTSVTLSVKEAIDKARSVSDSESASKTDILVTGSLFLVGAVLRIRSE